MEAKELGTRQSQVLSLYKTASRDLQKKFPIVTMGSHGDLLVKELPDAGDATQQLPKGYGGYTDAGQQVLLAK